MKRALEILAVAGFRISVGDHSNYWSLMLAVDQIDNTNVTRRAWDEVQDDDLLGKDVVICYSWGCASVFKALARLKKAGKLTSLPLLVVLAGVPRGLGQWLSVVAAGGWKVPDEVGVAICLQVNSVPTSYPVIPSGPTRVNRLLTGIDGNDHIGIQDTLEAHDLVCRLIEDIESHL